MRFLEFLVVQTHPSGVTCWRHFFPWGSEFCSTSEWSFPQLFVVPKNWQVVHACTISQSCTGTLFSIKFHRTADSSKQTKHTEKNAIGTRYGLSFDF